MRLPLRRSQMIMRTESHRLLRPVISQAPVNVPTPTNRRRSLFSLTPYSRAQREQAAHIVVMNATVVELTPGQRYLLRQLPNLVAPPAVVYLAARVARDHFHHPLPAWLLFLAYVLSWPVAFTLSVQWNDLSNKARARRWGAVIPRAVEHKYPGSLDVIKGIFRSDSSRYLGECPFLLFLVYACVASRCVEPACGDVAPR